MDIDTLTLGGTDYEDMLVMDATDTMSSDNDTGGDVSMAIPAGLGRYYNYSTLESVVSEAWEGARVRAPGVQLHEACVLLLSAVVVGLHGLLGLLPRSLLTAREAWLLLHAGLALACLYALACLLYAAHNALVRRLFRDDDDDVEDEGGEEEDEDVEAEGKAAAPASRPPTLEQSAAEAEAPLPAAVMESIVSAQLEKEERVQRWIDNLVPDREQMNLEACGEIKGRNMEAEVSSADLLGDGQLSQPPSATNAATAMVPCCPRPLPPPLPPAEVEVSQERRRALMLAYELSLAVRQQTAGNIRATLSAPEGRLQSVRPDPLTSLSSRSTLSEHKDAWKLVRRGKEALDESLLPLQGRPVPVTVGLPSPRPPKEFLESAPRRRRHVEEPRTAPRSAPPSAPGSPTADKEAALADSAPPTPPNHGAAGEVHSEEPSPSTSLLNFVRRFSGTRFLLRELANATTEGLSLGLRRPLALPQPQPQDTAPAAPAAAQRSVLALPKVSVCAMQAPAVAVRKAEAETSATRGQSNVMKVFSKGILSEGGSTVDISTTSIQQDAAQRHSAAASGAVSRPEALGAFSLLAQESPAAYTRKTTATAATSTAESDEVAAPALTKSTLNLSSLSLGARARDVRDPQDLGLGAPITPSSTSRGLTANMSEEGIPWPAPPARFADLDDEHKSLFDMKKSLLSSIPEAAPPDEDTPHYF